MPSRRTHNEPVNWALVQQRLKAAMEVTAGAWDSPPEVRQRNLEARARALARAREAEPESGPAIGAICFQLAGIRYAIEAKYVSEIVAIDALTPLPRTPSFVVGVYNLRGRPLPVFDLRRVLEADPATQPIEHWAVACGEQQPEFLVLSDAMAGIAPEFPAVSEPKQDAGPAWILGKATDGAIVLDGAELLADRQFFLDGEETTDPSGRGEGKG